jgi:hypothetical protein
VEGLWNEEWIGIELQFFIGEIGLVTSIKL